MGEPSFTLKEAAAIAEIEWPRLQQWIRSGYLNPAVRARKRGASNRFDLDDLIKIEVLKRLARINALEGAAPRWVASCNISKWGSVLYLVPNMEGTDWEMTEQVGRDEFYIAIPIGNIRKELKEKLS